MPHGRESFARKLAQGLGLRPPWSSELDAVENDEDDSVECGEDSVECGEDAVDVEEDELAGASPPRSSPGACEELEAVALDDSGEEAESVDCEVGGSDVVGNSGFGRGGRITSGAGVELTARTVA